VVAGSSPVALAHVEQGPVITYDYWAFPFLEPSSDDLPKTYHGLFWGLYLLGFRQPRRHRHRFYGILQLARRIHSVVE
jgi:hypothetical protein